MSESLRTRLLRWRFRFFPAYRGTGGVITYIASDFREIRVSLPLNWRTRNYVGTIFGGSMYGAVDPIYMLMLLWNLPKGYVVWDKAASIRFRRPGRSTLYARFTLDQAELDAIMLALQERPAVDRGYSVELADASGTVHAIVEKTVYIGRPREQD